MSRTRSTKKVRWSFTTPPALSVLISFTGQAASSRNTLAEQSPSKAHICKICSRPFARATDVKRHVNAVHLGLKKFECPVCGRGFAQKGGMQTHMNIQYVSSLCLYLSRMLIVCRLSTGNRPYNCRVNCGHPPFSDPSSRSRHEFEAHAPPSFECPEGCASFKRKDALKAHIREKHRNAAYPESVLTNRMTRERFNEEFLVDAIDEDPGASSTPEVSGHHRMATVYKRRKLISMDDEDPADDDNHSFWSAHSSNVSRNEEPETHAPTRRSTRLASKPLISMKEETPEWSRAPTPLPTHSAVHVSPVHSHHSTPMHIPAAPSLHPSRVPTPASYISLAGHKTPALVSRIGTPTLTVPRFHHPHTSHSTSPLASRAHSPSHPTPADMLVRHLATHNSHSTPPRSEPVSRAPSAASHIRVQPSQAHVIEPSLPEPNSLNPVGLGLMNVNLSLPLSTYFGTEPIAAPISGLGLHLSGHGPSALSFSNYSLNGTVNPQALHTPPVIPPKPSTSYFPMYAHPASAPSPFNPQLPSPAPTIFYPSPFTPSVINGEDLDEEIQRLLSPERPLMGVEPVDLSKIDPALFGC